ncbi:hypothetical protein CEXT_578821 [Caerostris extrusa]|uniref:Uncharacterized protein n=1 Tax=Caerostris extrusa TaxID=172846 RepID=A0AAV4QY14_CAEEX|nr:hypothetical protein CEXT_578821 [Caerostris extrusa]
MRFCRILDASSDNGRTLQVANCHREVRISAPNEPMGSSNLCQTQRMVERDGHRRETTFLPIFRGSILVGQDRIQSFRWKEDAAKEYNKPAIHSRKIKKKFPDFCREMFCLQQIHFEEGFFEMFLSYATDEKRRFFLLFHGSTLEVMPQTRNDVSSYFSIDPYWLVKTESRASDGRKTGKCDQ